MFNMEYSLAKIQKKSKSEGRTRRLLQDSERSSMGRVIAVPRVRRPLVMGLRLPVKLRSEFLDPRFSVGRVIAVPKGARKLIQVVPWLRPCPRKAKCSAAARPCAQRSSEQQEIELSLCRSLPQMYYFEKYQI